MPPAPGTRPIRPASTVSTPSARPTNAKRIAYGMPDVLGAQRSRYANKVVAVLGAGHSAVGTILDLAQLKTGRTGNGDRLDAARRHARRSPSVAAPTTSWPRAASSARSSPQLVQGGGVRVEAGFRLTHITANGRQAATGCRVGVLRPACRGRRADRRHRLPARICRSCASCASRSIPRSNARPFWRR